MQCILGCELLVHYVHRISLYSDEGNDIITEKDLVESLLEEANKYTHVMLKDEDFSIGIDDFGYYKLRHDNDEMQDGEVGLRLSQTSAEIEFEKDEENYELSNGLEGIKDDWYLYPHQNEELFRQKIY